MQLDERLIIAPIRSTKSGLPGPIGPQGPKGEPGVDGKAPQHQWAGTNLRFTNPDGSWGQYTDLKGDKGDPGSGGGGTSISVEDEAGNKAELEILKYDTTDQRIQYDPTTKTLALRSIEHAYQLDWTVNNTAELPTGDKYIGAVVYVKSDSAYVWYDGTNWNRLLSQDFSAEKLFSMMENGKWGDAHLTPTKDKIVLDTKDSFLGVFSKLSDLQSSPLKPVNGQSWAIVQALPSNEGVVANLLYTYVAGTWSAHPVNGNFLFDNSGRLVSVTHIKAGDNVTMDYNESRHELTINSAGPGSPTDLSKYVKGENVSSPTGDWSEVNWDEGAKTLSISVPKPDFDKMNGVLVAGDNVSFERDPTTGLLRIGAEFNPDFTPYVRGRGITANNGLNSSWDAATQQLTVGYSPKFTDVDAMFEAGDNITIEQGTGEKVKISATGGATPDLTEYAKKANIKIPAGYWGTTVVDADEVQLNVKPSADQFASMLSPNGDMNVEVDGDQVKLTTKDGRKRLYSVLTKTVGGKDPMLKAGRFMHLELDDVNRTIQLDCTAREFESTSVNTSLPLRSTWDGTNNNTTISFDMPAFANLTSPGGNVKVTYDDTQKKLAYNVDQSAIPVLAFKKAEEPSVSLGTLKINNGGSALTVTDDPDNPGKKLATLNLPDAYQVTGHANNKDQKMTDLTIVSDVDDQTLFMNGNLSLDLTKGYYVGRVNTQNDLPSKAVNDKSYGFVKSPNGFDRQYIFTNDAWTMYNPV
ncbi:MAG: collagen-like triple helix repeat-containing protein, partial [Cetobacterium sp.]|uniref:collagen-like triple helix repeat-containing protein n=1 Tax=Cetobacterium sp. TaxID=2071632 RepID=UPI003EE5F12D